MSFDHRPVAHPPAYTGVGSRQTPADVLLLMEHLAFRLNRAGWLLRTGGAEGADAAFLKGARAGGRLPCPAEVWLPVGGWRGHPSRYYPPTDGSGVGMAPWTEARRIASELHPAWGACSEFARRCHARNVLSVAGDRLGTALDPLPSRRVVCWTPGGEAVGGTAMAIRVAGRLGVPVVNLARDEDRRRVEGWLARR